MSSFCRNSRLLHSELLTLSSEHRRGTTQVVVAPARGAAIVDYSSLVGGEKINWFEPADESHVACFPLVPFASRIHRGRFQYAGQFINLPANLPPDEHAIHGHGFQRSWALEAVSADSATLSYTYEACSWPWTYRCEQHLHLDGEELTITLCLENLSDVPMPFGMGLHPYFPINRGLVITAKVDSHLCLDDELLPTGIEPVPQSLDMADGLSLGEQVLDNVFCGWQNRARLHWPESQRSLSFEVSRECDKLVVWAPSGESFCCVEPISNSPDGFNQGENIANAYAVLQAAACRSMTFSYLPSHA